MWSSPQFSNHPFIQFLTHIHEQVIQKWYKASWVSVNAQCELVQHQKSSKWNILLGVRLWQPDWKRISNRWHTLCEYGRSYHRLNTQAAAHVVMRTEAHSQGRSYKKNVNRPNVLMKKMNGSNGQKPWFCKWN